MGLILFVGFSWQSLHYGLFATDGKPWYDDTKAETVSNPPKGSFPFPDTKDHYQHYYAMNIVCLIISGTIKISVALVLYRLDSRPLLRAIIIFDIATCCVWTIATTLIRSLYCSDRGPYFGVIEWSTCTQIMIARESLYMIYDVFHVILSAFILWNVQISRGLKLSVIGLFSIGLL